MLTADDFTAFFREVHGYPPFPRQKRLLAQVAVGRQVAPYARSANRIGENGNARYGHIHLALEADRLAERRAPVRIAFVVDRRLVVDDAFERARQLAATLAAPSGGVTRHVAERLAQPRGCAWRARQASGVAGRKSIPEVFIRLTDLERPCEPDCNPDFVVASKLREVMDFFISA